MSLATCWSWTEAKGRPHPLVPSGKIRDTQASPPPLFLRPENDPARSAGRHLAIGLLRLAKAAGLRDRRGAVVSCDKPRRQRLQHFGRGRQVALQRVHAVELAFVVIEIGEVEA